MSCVQGGGGGAGGSGGGSGDGGGDGGDGGRGQPSSALQSRQSDSPQVFSVHHGEQWRKCGSCLRPHPCSTPHRLHVGSLHVHFEHQSSQEAMAVVEVVGAAGGGEAHSAAKDEGKERTHEQLD